MEYFKILCNVSNTLYNIFRDKHDLYNTYVLQAIKHMLLKNKLGDKRYTFKIIFTAKIKK